MINKYILHDKIIGENLFIATFSLQVSAVATSPQDKIFEFIFIVAGSQPSGIFRTTMLQL